MPAPQVSATVIRAYVDRATFDRGSDYARRGMVLSVEWSDAEGALTARVEGARGAVYRCRVWIGATDAPEGSVCSCPVSSDCKHVVAALLVGTRGSAGRAEDTAAPATAASPAGAARSAIGWRQLLEPARQSSTPLALGIELRTRGPAGARQWMPRPAVAAHPRDLARDPGEVLLAVRPLMRSDATGRWIQGEATWDGIRRAPLRFEAHQVRWFADFLGIARESLLSGTAGDWIVLDHVGSTLLWPHLRDSQHVGVPLVPTR